MKRFVIEKEGIAAEKEQLRRDLDASDTRYIDLTRRVFEEEQRRRVM